MRATALITGLDVIEIICNRGGASFGYLKDELQTSAPTLTAILNELTIRGFLIKENRDYKLGPVYPRLAAGFMKNVDLPRIAMPVLRELCDKTEETVELSIPINDGLLLVEKIEPREPVTIYSGVGDFFRIFHRTASGKVYLAYQSEDIRRTYYQSSGLVPNTEMTITDPDIMEQELEKIRCERIGLDIGENLDYVFRIAAPILDHTNKLTGIICVAGKVSRVDESKRKIFSEYVKDSGIKLTKSLGGE